MSNRALRYMLPTLVLCAAPLAGQVNGSFDGDLDGWELTQPEVDAAHSATEDAGGGCASGSALLTDPRNLVGPAEGLRQCVPVAGGVRYQARVWVRTPPGQSSAGVNVLKLQPHVDATCTQFGATSFVFQLDQTADGRWRPMVIDDVLMPEDAQSVELFLGPRKLQDGGSFAAFYDEVSLCPTGTCGIGAAPLLAPPSLPDFELRVTIGDLPGGLVPPGDCLPETVCVSGALPGRTEVLLRVLGPRPNGHLWFQAVRFTPAAVVIEARQRSTGLVRHYLLSAVAPGERPLGVEDRTAFPP